MVFKTICVGSIPAFLDIVINMLLNCFSIMRLIVTSFSMLNIIFNLLWFPEIMSLTNKKIKNKYINNYILQKKQINLLQINIFFFIDYCYIHTISKTFLLNKKQQITTSKLRLSQTNWTFYNNLIYSNMNFIIHYYTGIKFIISHVKDYILAMLLSMSIMYYLLYIKLLTFNKLVFEWTLIIMFLYWLFSGFVFFIKKYQYSKFTSVIQRFWKRTYILFWLIESGVFLIFFFNHKRPRRTNLHVWLYKTI